jgi:glycosyltransferase involved in cell wall biosynthesis
MACGKPVVTTASGGVSDIVTPDNGIKVPIGDHQSLAEGIAQIKTGSRVFHAEKIRRSVLDRFEIGIFVEKLSKQYQEVKLRGCRQQ